MNVTRKEPDIVLGGSPRADLLPPEIKAAAKLRADRRGFIALLIVVVVLVAGGIGAANWLARTNAAELDASDARTAQILQEQLQYAEVNNANLDIAAGEIARSRATSTEIDWESEITDIVGTLPDGAVLASLTATSSTTLDPVTAPLSPLEGDRIAELQLTVNTTGIPDTASWIRDLSSLKGFVDATPSTLVAGQGGVVTTLILHLNSEVYWNRFPAEAAK